MLKKFFVSTLCIAMIFVFSGCGSDDGTANELFEAVMEDDHQTMRELLEQAGNISLEDCKLAEEETGDCRILGGALELYPIDETTCRILIENGAELNSLNEEGATYLHQLIARSAQEGADDTKYIRIMETLLREGANVNQTGRGDYAGTALDYLMLQSPTTTPDFDTICQLLHSNQAKVTERTLKNCLKSDSRFSYGKDLLQTLERSGVDTGLSETLKALILEQPDDKIMSLIRKGEYKRREKNNIVFFTAAHCSPQVMELLKSEEFDLTQHASGGLSRLDIASICNDGEMIDYLLQEGENLEESDDCGYEADEPGDEDLLAFQRTSEAASYTPLSLSLRYGKKENADHLLQAGAKFQDSALCIATIYGGKQALDFLLEQNYKSKEYFTYQSFLSASDEMVVYMLDKGIDYNVSDGTDSLMETLQATGNKERYDLIQKHR